jgi:hypothetical protein
MMMRIETAGKRFCAGTGCGTPAEAVAKGLKKFDEWLEFVAQIRTHLRSEAAKKLSVARNGKTPTEYGHQRTLEQRQMILDCVRKHSEQYAWGMLIREIMHETGIDDPRTREICHALLAEGLLCLGRVRRGGVRSNAHLYRIGEVQP